MVSRCSLVHVCSEVLGAVTNIIYVNLVSEEDDDEDEDDDE